MQGRSRTAAFAFALPAGVGLALASALVATAWPSMASAADAAVVNRVTLRIKITGLGESGCEVEVKPGHPSSSFKPVTKKVDRNGQLILADLEVASRSADRDCTFAITVKEPGQPDRTTKRGYRLDAATAAAPVPRQMIDCLLRSPSLAARDDATRRIK